MEEKIVGTRSIYNGRIVNLYVHEVILPDGQHSKREVIKHPGAVAIVALDEARQVFLVRQFRIGAGRITVELPAGVLGADEPPEECAQRELQEEIGYKPGKMQALGGFFNSPAYTSEYIHLYLATELEASKLSQDHDEFLEVLRVPFEEALAMIARQEIIDAKTIIGLLQVARQSAL
ncbi:MAG: NUDIX hydrolase [Anaerolineae bacterium]|jgi:ADP-ribose pyrophosphatase|nr:NUDIX hydrolase [Anaerolineae bacterium]